MDLNNEHFNEHIISRDYASGIPKPTYELEHLATFKIKNAAEIRKPKEKLKTLIELDKTGGIWPVKMFMCFSGQWLLMLDEEMREIENFPGSLITEPTAFISENLLEAFNNILIFTVSGVSLGNTEMHIFQVSDVSAVDMVEDLKTLSGGKIVTIDRNVTSGKNKKKIHNGKDQYGLVIAAAEVATEQSFQDQEQTSKDIKVLNHCFEDIERFVTRLQYAAEALRELELRKNDHNTHGGGLLVQRSRPPSKSEFEDILAKHKLAFNYVNKLQNHFPNSAEPVHNIFVSLKTIVNVCNDVYVATNIVTTIIHPLLKRDTMLFINNCANNSEKEFWHTLGPYWNKPRNEFQEHKFNYQPTFYDDWTPEWVVDDEDIYISSNNRTKLNNITTVRSNNSTWLARLQSRNVKISEVIYNKTASNDKELDVFQGEYLEILDNSRNWWKARNSAGSIGYVPHTVLIPHNYDNLSVKTDYIQTSNKDSPNMYSLEQEKLLDTQQQTNSVRTSMPRSYSMPNVPIPPPLPPPSEQNTPNGTIKKRSPIMSMLPRNDSDADEVNAIYLQDNINAELKIMIMQREKRKDLEILKTPQIYIDQNSSSKEIEEWLSVKGFSDAIVKKLSGLNGGELFALSPHVIEGYFGQKESRRLISQIILQKNICEYRTVRSSELTAKLARARQKVDQQGSFNSNEIF